MLPLTSPTSKASLHAQHMAGINWIFLARATATNWAPLGMTNGVLLHKEGQSLLLRCFKEALVGYLGEVLDTFSGSSQHLRHHSMPKWLESIAL